MIEQLPESSERILGVKISGKLHDEDYKNFVPVMAQAWGAYRHVGYTHYSPYTGLQHYG